MLPRRLQKPHLIFTSGLLTGAIITALLCKLIITSQPTDRPSAIVEEVKTPIYQPKITHEKIIDTVKFFDTVKVIKDYFTEKIIIDTFFIDTTVKIFIYDTLYNNNITARKIEAEKVNYILPPPKEKLKFGTGTQIGYNFNDRKINLSIFATASKNNNSFAIGYNTKNFIFIGYERRF